MELMTNFGGGHLSEEMPQVRTVGRSAMFEVKGRGARPSVVETITLSIEVLGDKFKTIALSIVNH